MRFINCTPHSITIQHPDGSYLHIPMSGYVARVQFQRWQETTVDDIPVWATRIDGAHIFGWPPDRELHDATPENAVIITSSLVAQIVHRYRGLLVVAPDTGPTAKRYRSGEIEYIRGLAMWDQGLSL